MRSRQFFYLNYYYYYYYFFFIFPLHGGDIACMRECCSGRVLCCYVSVAVVSDIYIATTDDCWPTCRAGHLLSSRRTQNWHSRSSSTLPGPDLCVSGSANTWRALRINLTNPDNTAWQSGDWSRSRRCLISSESLGSNHHTTSAPSWATNCIQGADDNIPVWRLGWWWPV